MNSLPIFFFSKLGVSAEPQHLILSLDHFHPLLPMAFEYVASGMKTVVSHSQ